MPGKTTRSLSVSLACAGGLLLSACSSAPAILGGGDKGTVEVSSITSQSPAPAAAPALYCKAGGLGEALFGKRWESFNDTLFVLHQGSYSSVAFLRKGGTEAVTVQALYDSGGQKMIFCPFSINTDPAQRIACTSLYTIEDDLQAGIKRTFDIPGVLRGAMISCADAPDHLKTLTPPIEGGQ